jgi:hypothetical protein
MLRCSMAADRGHFQQWCSGANIVTLDVVMDEDEEYIDVAKSSRLLPHALKEIQATNIASCLRICFMPYPLITTHRISSTST